MDMHNKLLKAFRDAGAELPVNFKDLSLVSLFYYQQSFVKDVSNQLKELASAVAEWAGRGLAREFEGEQLDVFGKVFLDVIARSADYHLNGERLEEAIDRTLEEGPINKVTKEFLIQRMYRKAVNFTPPSSYINYKAVFPSN